MDIEINKAHNVGDVNPNKPYEVWTEYQPGKFDWRRKKGGNATQPAASTANNSGTGSNSADTQTTQPKQSQPTATPPAVKQDKIPTPKIKYSVGPHPDAPFEIPETWTDSKTGKQQHRDTIRQLAATKWTDDNVLNILNNPKNGANLRQIAFEEAAARGIPEDKIDVSGTLQKKWDELKRMADMKKKVFEDEEEEEEYEIDDSLLRGWDREKFMSQFGKDEEAWDNPEDYRVAKEFNGMKTLDDRRKFDAFVDIQRRLDPEHTTVNQRLSDLGWAMSGFLKKKKVPMFVSMGGAGAGKSTKLEYVLEANGLKAYDETTMTPQDGDYDYVFVDHSPMDADSFQKVLTDFNGKIIIFDDKDKPLTTTSNPYMAVMKAVSDEKPHKRIFQNQNTKDRDLFTGKLIFLTNKSKYTLYKNEDTKGVMSRSEMNEIKLTINETLDLLRKRYKTMGSIEGLDLTKAEEEEARQLAFDYIMSHRDKLDPATFTVRHFNRVLAATAGWLDDVKTAQQDPQMLRGMGGLGGLERRMRDTLKAEIGDDGQWIEKAEDILIRRWHAATEEEKENVRQIYRDHPDLFIRAFDRALFDYLKNGEKDNTEDVEEEKEVKKAFESALGDMTLEEAENILLS